MEIYIETARIILRSRKYEYREQFADKERQSKYHEVFSRNSIY